MKQIWSIQQKEKSTTNLLIIYQFLRDIFEENLSIEDIEEE